MKAFLLACSLPRITLFPTTSSLLSPLEFRRSQDFSISSDIQFLCNNTYPVTMKWIIRNCSLNCSFQMNFNNLIITTLSELYIPRQTLAYGLYQFQCIVQSIYSTNLSVSSLAYVKINPSDVIANFVRLGSSMITQGAEQDLLLDPGSYSVDPDANSFDASVNKLNY